MRMMLMSLVLCAPLYSATIHVPSDVSTIQGGIAAANPGDLVLVATGTYVENINLMGKAIELKSEHGPELTIIDGSKSGTVVVMDSNEGLDTVLQGFTIRNGGVSPEGGGIRCVDASPTIIHNIIENNLASKGGGIYCSGDHCVIKQNLIRFNEGGLGGGIYLSGTTPLVIGNTICNNIGGAEGGGVYYYASAPLIADCAIVENSTIFESGGGIYCNGIGGVITNCTITKNSTDGTDGYGGGICMFGRTVVTNCIVWSNWAAAGNEIHEMWGIPFADVKYCDVKGGWPGVGNISKDPLFFDWKNNDIHLTHPSPCRDAGTMAPHLQYTDFENDPRVVNGVADMGCDEFHTHLYHTGSSVPGQVLNINFVGSGAVGLFVSAGVIDPPLPTQWGDWYLAFPILMALPLGQVPATGILNFSMKTPHMPPGPHIIPIQGLAGSQLSNLDIIFVL